MWVVCANTDRQYEVALCRDLLANPPAGLLAALQGRRTLVVTTPTVSALFGRRLAAALKRARVDAKIAVVPMGEAAKTPESLLAICRLGQEAGLRRRDAFLAFSGGVCCDMVTVAAALHRRGVDYICVPTTLIGQVDAAIGIKGAVNFNGAKSSLGVFYPPHSSWIDPGFLSTLPSGAVSDGLAEILKIALSCDCGLFERLEDFGEDLLASRFASPAGIADEVLTRAIALTIQELEPNLYERQSLRRLLDFGHTFSPLLEARSSYRLSHGQAVAVDMAYSTSIAEELGFVDRNEAARIYRVMQRLGLPTDTPILDVELAGAAVESASAHRGGSPNVIVPRGVGSAAILDDSRVFSRTLLRAALSRLRSAEAPTTSAGPAIAVAP